MPDRMSHAPAAGTAHAISRAGSHLTHSALGRASVGQDVSPAVWGQIRPCGPLRWVIPDPRAPQHRTTQLGGGSAARGCVGRCKEDAGELPQGCAPHWYLGCCVWVPSRIPRGLVPHSVSACCAGRRGQGCDLEAGFLPGGPDGGAAPLMGVRAPS